MESFADRQLAPRPVIQTAPDVVAYGAPFTVQMASAAAISRLTLVRLGSAAQGVNTDQRFLELPFTQAGTALDTTAPVDGNVAPPGAYMLFALDAMGVPSVARIVRFEIARPTAWEFLASSDGTTPTCRHEAAMVELDGKLYLMGGRGSRPVEEYDPVTGRWRSLGKPPFEVHHFQPVVLDGTVYVVGAFTGGFPNENNVPGVWTWEPVSNVWTQVSTIPAARRRAQIGTVRIEVVEPLRTLRVIVDDDELGADLTFEARSAAWEEPRFTRYGHDTRLVMDYTRLTQWGRWSGSVEVDGERIVVDELDVVGVRDRSWGIRSVGEGETGVPGRAPQFFWLWAPLHFDDYCLHFACNDSADGIPWYTSGVVLPDVAPGGATWGPDAPGAAVRAVDHEITWRPGTRRVERARLVLEPWRADPIEVELEPVVDFQMRGVGYFHPEFRHGCWLGEEVVGHDTLVLADVDPIDFVNLHIQSVVRATAGDEVGVGVLEQLVIGPHEPTGLTGLADGAS